MKKSSRRVLEVESLESLRLLSSVVLTTVTPTLVTRMSHLAGTTPVAQTSQVHVLSHTNSTGLTAARTVSYSTSSIPHATPGVIGTDLTSSRTYLASRSPVSGALGSFSSPLTTRVSQVHAMVLPGGKSVMLDSPTTVMMVSPPSALQVGNSAKVGVAYL